MADPKYHWAIPVSDQSKHRNIQACGRKYTTALAETAVLFMAKVKANSDWYCSDCAKAARLALAKESAPKPDTHTDSDRYADLRKLVEAWQAKREDALLIGGTEPQSLTDAANDLATWRHR